MVSVDNGMCGPCCSNAPKGSTATLPSRALASTSGQDAVRPSSVAVASYAFFTSGYASVRSDVSNMSADALTPVSVIVLMVFAIPAGDR